MTSARHPFSFPPDVPASADAGVRGEGGAVRLDDLPRRPPVGGRERVLLKIPRDTHYLALIRKVVSDVAVSVGFDRWNIDKIELAVDEACSNAIVYQVTNEGVGKFDELEIEVVVERPSPKTRAGLPRTGAESGALRVILRDAGDPYPFEAEGNIDLEDHLRSLEPGGLGIYIIKSFMDEVAYEHSPHAGNTLSMVKYLP